MIHSKMLFPIVYCLFMFNFVLFFNKALISEISSFPDMLSLFIDYPVVVNVYFECQVV